MKVIAFVKLLSIQLNTFTLSVSQTKVHPLRQDKLLKLTHKQTPGVKLKPKSACFISKHQDKLQRSGRSLVVGYFSSPLTF